MKTLLCFAILTVSLPALSDPIGTIKQIDQSAKKAAVEVTSDDLSVGAKLVHTFSDKTQCFFRVIKTQGDIATVDLSGCVQADHIKVGDSLEKSLIESDATSEPLTPSPQPVAPLAPESTEPVRFARKLENWYIMFNLGYSSVSYKNADTKAAIDQLESLATVDKAVPIGLDLVGIYMPLNQHRTMVGGVISGSAESWEGPGGELSIYQYFYGASVQHYFNRTIGDGFYVRADLGFSWYLLKLDTTTLKEETTSDTEFGAYQLGIGYALPLSTNTSWNFSATFSHKDSEDEKADAINIMIGWIW